MPKLSIITPALIDNNAKLQWLREMVDSVLSQSFQDWEMIIADDHSPVQPILLETDKRVRIFRMAEHSGPALARNTAVAIADGEALLPLDADDLLPAPDVLGRMYEAWKKDKTKTIYGNLQFLTKTEDGNFKTGRVVELPEYSFQAALDPRALMPVTVMHSKECHRKAGGWKPELDVGLEDVEYWIAAGKAGCCGQRINAITLLYRRHKAGRHNMMRQNYDRETAMRNKIIQLHQDVYDGRMPMGGCECGGGKSYAPPTRSKAEMARGQQTNITLDQLSINQKVWVEYIGRREASFQLNGPFTKITYTIDGPGCRFQVHVNDLPKLRLSGRGQDFKVGVTPPDGQPSTAVIEQSVTEPPFQAGEPALATIEQYDQRAAQKFAVVA